MITRKCTEMASLTIKYEFAFFKGNFNWDYVNNLLFSISVTMQQLQKDHRSKNFCLKLQLRASLVVQWLRIHLLMQATQVRALVREDPTYRGATKSVHHNYWACALEPASHNYWTRVPQLLKPEHPEPKLHKRSHQNEKPPLAPTRESLHAATKTQRSQKINK